MAKIKTRVAVKPVSSGIPKLWAWLPYILFCLALAIFALNIAAFFVPAFLANLDDQAYFVSMRNIATRGEFAQRIEDPAQFVGEMWVETEPGVFYAKYPIGYPLIGAAVFKLGGPTAPFYINPVAMGLMLVGTFFLGRAMVSPLAGALAALALGAHGLIRFYGLAAMSHALDMCVVTWAMFFLWRWYQTRRWGAALCAGLLLGFAVSIRYADAVFWIVPVNLFIVAWRQVRGENQKVRWLARSAAVMAAGTLVSLIPLLVYETVAFGAPGKTAYGLTGESTSFSWGNFAAHAPGAAEMLFSPQAGVFLLGPLAIAGCVLLWRGRQTAAVLMLVGWTVPTPFLYAAYYWMPPASPELYGRLFMTTYPAIAIAGFAPVLLLERRPAIWRAFGLVAGLSIIAAFYNDREAWDHVVRQSAVVQDSRKVAVTTMRELPSGSSVVCDGLYVYYLDYIGGYRMYYSKYFDPKWISEQVKDQREPTARHNLNSLRAERFVSALGGRDETGTNAVLKSRLLSDVRGGRRLALITRTGALASWRERLGPEFIIKIIDDDLQGVGSQMLDEGFRGRTFGLYSIEVSGGK